MVTIAPNRATDGLEDVNSFSPPQQLRPRPVTGILVIDDAGRISALSTDAEGLLGLPTIAAVGRGVDVLPEALRDLIRQTASTNEPAADRPLLISTPAGGSHPVRVTVAPTYGTGGKRTGITVVLNDAAIPVELDQHLRHMDRLASIGTLSASMAHEVKNAMVAVKTFIDLLIRKNQDEALTEIVNREMQRINSIVSQMLRFAGPGRPTLANIRLHGVIEQSLCLVEHHLEGRKIRLTRRLDASSDLVRADAYQLEQAFINLFFNALDAVGADGELTVATELVKSETDDGQSASCLRVTVRDNGIGIAPENLPRLFEPFFTTKPNGTGLGLPITRRIIEEHHGKITVASELHHGTTFTLLLPSASRQP